MYFSGLQPTTAKKIKTVRGLPAYYPPPDSKSPYDINTQRSINLMKSEASTEADKRRGMDETFEARRALVTEGVKLAVVKDKFPLLFQRDEVSCPFGSYRVRK